MDDLRLPAVAARLVAWHNRHPLARRIGVSHVHAIGYVAVPCVGGPGAAAPAEEPAPAEGGSLRERAQARARQHEALAAAPPPAIDRAALTADFSEDFIDPLSPRQVARFALRAGQALAVVPQDGPVRQVRADGAHPGRAPVLLYLLTAVIETGTRKSRVLLGGGDAPAVLGQRIWSRPRVAAVGGTSLLVTAALFAVLRPVAHAPAGLTVAVAPAVQPASAAASAAAAVPVSHAALHDAPHEAPPAAAAASAAEAGDAHPPPVVSAAAPAASAALDVEPHLGKIDMPSIRPQLSDEARSAARQARPPGARVASAPAAAMPVAAEPVAAPIDAAFALSTRVLRTRAEADQVRVAMQALLKTVASEGVHVDVLPQGDDWRVVGLPFATRAAADKARALLVSRGMRVEVIGF